MVSPRPIGELLATLFATEDGLPQSFVDLLDRLEALDGRRVPAPNSLSDTAFRREIEIALPQLRAFAISLTRDRSVADDLVQDTLMKAWAARDRFQAGTNFRAWSFVIARNLFLTERRRAKFKGAWDELSASRLLTAPASQEHSVHLSDLERAMGDLPAAQREALMLVGAAGLGYEQAAEVMKVAVGTVKSRVARARQALDVALHGTSTPIRWPSELDGLAVSLRPPS